MLTKKKMIRIISLIYWLLIIVNTLFLLVAEIFEEKIDFSFLATCSIQQMLSIIGTLFVIFFFFLIVTMLKYFYFTVLYFGGIVAIKKFYKEKSDITDKKTAGYYRDVLTKYSIGELGYIKDFNVGDAELAATLLLLQLKSKISITDRIIVKDKNTDDLSISEAYVLENIVNGSMGNINLVTFKSKIVEECINKKLLTTKNDYKKKRNKKIIIYVMMMVIFTLIFNFLPDIFNNSVTSLSEGTIAILLLIIFAGFVIMIIMPFILILRLFIYMIMNRLDPYVRTKEAMELNEKMNGLENFMKDFSILEERKSQELKLWKYYLIYSVLFEQNTITKDELLLKLKNC